MQLNQRCCTIRLSPVPPSHKTTVVFVLKKPSVLVVDDVVDGREMLAEYLAFRGFQVTEAASGCEALDVARSLRPDIILMDLAMPDVDGLETTRRLKADALTKHAMIVAVTARAFPHDQKAARDAGCDAVVVKPYDLVLLADALARVLRLGVSAFDITG